MAFAETQELAVRLDLKGNFNAKLGDAARAIQKFDKATGNTQRSLGKFGSNIQRGVAVGLAATTAGFLGVVKAASDYESAFAGVRKTVTATEPQLKDLSDSFRQLAKDIPISASELARLGEAGGALGVPTDQLKEFVRVTALLGVTTNLTADEAADSLGVLGNVLKLTGAEYSKFASSLVALGNAGASTERDIVAIAERAGAAGTLIGVSTEQILGFSSAVASLGIESEAGGTAVQKFFIDSAKAVAGGGKDLKTFAKVAGVSAKDFQKAFKDDAGGALQDFLEGLGKLPQAQQLAVLANLGFDDSRITRTLLGLANNTKLVSDQMNVANKAFAENTALTKEAEQRFNTFDSQLQITKNTLTDMAITIGSKLLPKITPLLKRLNEFINANQDKISAFGDKLATGFEKFADAIQKVDWKPFIDGLKLTSSIAKTAIDLFMALPAEVKAIAIGAFAVNKVTGGLATSIAKDIGGAVLSQFAGRGSSAVNPLWVQQVGLPGVPGGNVVRDAAGNIIKTVVVPIAATVAAREVLNAVIPDMALAQSNLDRATARAEAARAAVVTLGPPTPSSITAGGFDSRITTRGAKASGGKEDTAYLAQLTRGTNAQLNDGFRQMVAALKSSRGDKAITAALKTALDTVITRQKGNVKNTELTLAGLRSALKNTNDPQLQRALRSAIAKVERKVTGRKEVAQQLAKADQIVRSGRTTAQKIAGLERIEKDLGNKSVRATEAVRKKLESVRTAARDAGRHSANAIKAKKFSVTVNVPPPTVSIRQFANGSRIVSAYGTNRVRIE